MRITGGRARGIRLKVPGRGAIRPAMDSLRERVFSSLGAHLDAARVLDLFAGTGSYGLEALSRGADSVVFVERDRSAVACLEANLVAVRKSLQPDRVTASIVGSDVLRWRPGPGKVFDVVFADPPFTELSTILPPLFRMLSTLAVPDEGLWLVLELPGRVEPEAVGWDLIRRIGKGSDQPTCCLYRRGGVKRGIQTYPDG